MLSKRELLFKFIEEKNYAEMEILLRDGACPNWYYHFSDWLETPLHRAVRTRDEKMISLLLAHKGDLAATDQTGQTPIQYAIPKIIGFIARMKDTDKRDLFRYSETIKYLIQARDNNHLKLVLAAGADPNHPIDRNYQDKTVRERPLHLAMRSGTINIIASLLEKRGDLSLVDHLGNTPIAQPFIDHSVIKYIVHLKKTDEKDSLGFGRALARVIGSYSSFENFQYTNLVYSLLKAGAPTDARKSDYISDTMLHHAVRQNQSRYVFLLRSFGANADAINIYNEIPGKINPEYFEDDWLYNQLNLYLASVCMVLLQGLRQGNHLSSIILTRYILFLAELARHYNHSEFNPEILINAGMQLKNISRSCLVTEHKYLGFFQSYQSQKLIETLDKCSDVMESENHIENYITDQTPKEKTTVTLLAKYHFITGSKADKLISHKDRFETLITNCSDEITKNKNNAPLYFKRACLYQHQQKPLEAWQDYLKAIELNPDFKPACDGFIKFLKVISENGQLNEIKPTAFFNEIKKLPMAEEILKKCLKENSPLNIYIRSDNAGFNKFLTGFKVKTLLEKIEEYLLVTQKKQTHTIDL